MLAAELTTLECADLLGWTPRADGTQLDIAWQAGGRGTFHHAEAAEYPDRVEVAIVGEFPSTFRSADWRAAFHAVTLAAPLGDRRVIETTTGKRLGRFEPISIPLAE